MASPQRRSSDPITLVERLGDGRRAATPSGQACIWVVQGTRLNERFLLPAQETGQGLLIGRAPSMDIVLDDPTVSRAHASLEWLADGPRLNDHGSTNGTWLADRMITTHPLQNGDRFRVGHTTFLFGFVAQASTQPVRESRGSNVARRTDAASQGSSTVSTRVHS